MKIFLPHSSHQRDQLKYENTGKAEWYTPNIVMDGGTFRYDVDRRGSETVGDMGQIQV